MEQPIRLLFWLFFFCSCFFAKFYLVYICKVNNKISLHLQVCNDFFSYFSFTKSIFVHHYISYERLDPCVLKIVNCRNWLGHCAFSSGPWYNYVQLLFILNQNLYMYNCHTNIISIVSPLLICKSGLCYVWLMLIKWLGSSYHAPW